MRRQTKYWLAFVAVGLVLGLALLMVRIGLRVGVTKPMNVHDTVVMSVKSWAKYPRIPSDDAVLEVVWAETISKHDFRFHPEGVQSLVTRLQDDFRQGPVRREIRARTKDFYADTNKGGKIKTVNDLVNAVDQSPAPQ